MSHGKTVLVTGAARRIGRGIALRFAREGYDVALHYNRSAGEAEAVAEEIRALGRAVTLVPAELADPFACTALIERVAGECPGLVGLVNSASIFAPDTLDTMSLDFYREQMAVNAEAPLLTTQAFHRVLDGPGWVVNLVDCKVFQLTPDFFSYTLSKLALESVTKMCAMACAPKLRVNGVAPGLVLRSGSQTDEIFHYEHDRIPLRVGTTVDHIADAVIMLAGAVSTTGQIISVDGGRHFYTPAALVAEFEVPEKLRGGT